MIPTAEGSTAAEDAYTMVLVQPTFRVNSDNSFTPITNITAQSDLYGVQFTFTVLTKTVQADGAPPLAAQKTGEVNQICAHPHVQDFRTEQDQGPSSLLYNYAMVTVGTDDEQIVEDVQIRMDSIGLPSAFAAIDAAWARLVALGAT